jgi:outer membrane immunogenic protein
MGAATGFAQAADPPMLPPVVEAPAFDWSGFYVGASIGGQQVNVTSPDPVGFVQPSGTGFTIGAFAGANKQINNFVLGVEGDIEYSTFSATASCANPAWTCTTNLNAQGSFRGRIGFAADRALLYVTGGLAVANFGGNTTLGPTVFPDSSARIGWTAGAGIDFAFTDTVFGRAQYRYSNYGSRTMNYDIPYPNVAVSTHQFTVGIGALIN